MFETYTSLENVGEIEIISIHRFTAVVTEHLHILSIKIKYWKQRPIIKRVCVHLSLWNAVTNELLLLIQ